MALALWHIDPASGSLTSVTAEGGALVLPLRRVAPANAALLAGPVEVWRDLVGRDYRSVDPTLGAPLLRVQHTPGGGSWPGPNVVAFVRAWFATPPQAGRAAKERRVTVDFKVASGRGETRNGASYARGARWLRVSW